MSVPFIQSSFIHGEVAPSLFGRTDLAAYRSAASTFRNGFVSYRGGYMSRAGTKFVGYSKQTTRSYAPRLVPFSFSINQGLVLEFGHYYMRVISNGAYVTLTPADITGATQANPCVLTLAASNEVASATANIGAVGSSYASGDTILIAGGTFIRAATLTVANTTVHGLTLSNPGIGNYAPGDTVTLAGGVSSVSAQISVTTTKVVSATVAAAGTGGTSGTQTVTGTTGTGTKFQASVTIGSSGGISAVLSITVAGSYTANPTTPATEPVTGASLSGAQLNVVLGIDSFSITAGGTFTTNAVIFTQGSTSGTGTGATFVSPVFAPNALTVTDGGVYTVFPTNPASQASTSGSGLGATYTLVAGTISSVAVGDWIYVSGVTGMTELNGGIFVVSATGVNTATLNDVFGNAINSISYGAYTGSGTAAPIYTVTSPYAESDLAYLKFIQSADVMSLACVNSMTNAEYAPRDLTRNSDTDWSFA
ncbi:MAG: hypothetical protein KGJ13_09070, partial [Patescibacteria group bacterium]|nr:hypothetical protein [Patescibacteria group bacterium]